uniref:Hypothetical mitochondrial protein 24 n=1 Tax=Physarum polycephalum TaxID=5791 RepID=F2Y9T8_PHYPO|nr:hypothetical mitochondrial protein 24 [Physarum polycephalum]
MTPALQKTLLDIEPFIQLYLPETRRFLYTGPYLKRKKRIKYTLRISAFEKKLVQNDYVLTLTNDLKTFSELNTGLLQYHYKKLNKLSLTSVARLKREIFFHTNEMLYLTHRFMDLRNLNLKMFRNQYQIISFSTYARPLNKLLFFNIFQKLNAFSLKFPSLIMYHYKKFKRLRVYYLGFRLILKRKKMDSLLIGSPLIRSRYKRIRHLKRRYLLKIIRAKFKRLY